MSARALVRGRTFVCALVAAISCAPAASNLPRGPRLLTVTMDEFSFEHDTGLSRGRTVVEAVNEGARPHELVMVILPENVPPIEEQLAGSERRAVAILAQVPTRRAGQDGSFAVDLDRGRYAFLCFLEDGDGESHARKGMASEFRVP